MKIRLTAHWRERVPGEELEVSDSVGLALIADGVAVSLDDADAAGITAEAEPVEIPPRAGQGSGREKWADYAAAKGVTVDDEASRDEIIAALDNAGVATAVVEPEPEDAGADNA